MATSQTVASTQTTKQPATPRTRAIKAKPVPAQAVSTQAAPTPSTQSVPEPTPVAVELTLDDLNGLDEAADDTTPKSARTELNEAVGVRISAARVRRHFDRLTLNKMIDTEIKHHKEIISSYELAKTQNASNSVRVDVETTVDGKKKTVVESRPITPAELEANAATVAKLASIVGVSAAKVAALSRERSRFSNESSLVLAIVGERIISQVASHTMNRALCAKKKIIQIAHMHEGGIEKLPLYPLINTLPSFVSYKSKYDAAAEAAKLKAIIDAAVAEKEKELKKKYADRALKSKQAKASKESIVPDTVAAPVTVAESEPVEEPACIDDTDDAKTSFKFYVHKVCDDVKKQDERFKSIRISTEICVYLSDLLVEFIHRTAPLILLTANSMKNKTINELAIMRTIEFIMTDMHSPVETVTLRDELVLDTEFVKKEIAKRDVEKTAGREYKIDLDKVPKVDGFVATRSITYPTSGFEALAAEVNSKLEIYAKLTKKEKVVTPEAAATVSA